MHQRTLLIAPALLLPLLSAQQPEAAPAPARATQSFRIQVEDDRGRPAADVAIVLGEDHANGFGFDVLHGAEPVRTGADGVATLQCPATQARTFLMAQAQVLCEPPVRVGLAALPAGSQHWTMRLPPTGQVRVLAYAEDERPLPGVTWVDLALVGNQRFFDRVQPAGRAQPEGALFARVALGQKLRVKATLADTHGALEVERDGPTRAGELVVVDLRLREAHLLTLRLLGLDGAPAADTQLGGFLMTKERTTTIELSTGADGTLRYVLPPGFVGAEQGALHLLRRGPDAEYLGAFRVPLAEEWHGTRALGDVKLVEEPPAVTGTLVDDAGKPLAGVTLVAETSYLCGARFSHADADSSAHRVRTDEQGRFCLRELEPRAASLVIRSEGGLFLAAGSVVRVGDNAARLEGARPGSAIVELPGVPAGLTTRCLDLRRRRADQGPGDDIGAVAPQRVTTKVGVEFASLQPGTYDLLVGVSSLGPPMHRIEKIEIRGGELCSDPRLRLADWQQHLRLVRCVVEGAAELRRSAQLAIGEVASNGYSWHGFGMLDEVPPQLLVPRGRKLIVQGSSCTTIVVDDPSGDVKLALAPRPRVQLNLPRGTTVPKDLLLRLGPTERPWLDSQVEVPCGDAKTWTLLPDGAGPFTVTLRAPNGNGTFTDVWSGALVIPAGPGPHDLLLPIDAQAAKDLRERLAAPK